QERHRWNARSPRAASPASAASAAAGNSRISEPAMRRASMVSARSIRPYRMSDDADAVGARFRNPCLTFAAEHLTHVGVFAITRKALELLGRGIKTHDGIG